MQLIENEKVINILEKTLNHMDSRLVDHGKRVAYLMFRMLEPLHKYDDKHLRDICILTMLHDVGAYKTEEIDKMIVFETVDVWEHSIYGYLFLKYFSPLKDMAQAVLFHHAENNKMPRIDPEYQFLAQLISFCDRADIYALQKRDEDFRSYVEKYRDNKYRGDIIDMFLASNINISCVYDDMYSDEEFIKVFYGTPLTVEEVTGYLEMIIFSIEFRSSQTVIHTVTTICIAVYLADLLGADKNDIPRIRTGAMLHDIGKIGIPVKILESADRLNDSDMKIMRTHVEITEKILKGNVEDDIIRIACRHHEKLDGSGYPKQLSADDITLYERIIAIADIFSALCGKRNYKDVFPKEKIVGILNDMSGRFLDPQIVELAIEHYDNIINIIETESIPVLNDYKVINDEYVQLRKEIETMYKAA